MIQIALLGMTPIVVEEGLRKSVPEKLYIIHTKNESNYKFETEAQKLKTKIEIEHKIPTFLIKVDAFDMDEIIRIILTTISKERKSNKILKDTDFAINLTGGTKLMVAAAATAAYLAGSKVYYVLESKKARGEELVKELPMPIRPRDDDKGTTTKTTSVVLAKLKELGKTNNAHLLTSLNADKKIKKLTAQKLGYHLKKLEENNLITITRGWEIGIRDGHTGRPKIDHKTNTIQLTSTGEYYAQFPDLVGNLS